VQVLFDQIISSIGYVRSGEVRALAVTTATRSQTLPDIPTLADFVAGYEASTFFGIGAPKRTPAEIIELLNRQVNVGLGEPDIKARLADLGGTVLPGSPAELGRLAAEETEKWGKVVKFSDAKPD
jgi:tripartite-type tricarboxylate transporter receptor subunit TctC